MFIFVILVRQSLVIKELLYFNNNVYCITEIYV